MDRGPDLGGVRPAPRGGLPGPHPHAADRLAEGPRDAGRSRRRGGDGRVPGAPQRRPGGRRGGGGQRVRATSGRR